MNAEIPYLNKKYHCQRCISRRQQECYGNHQQLSTGTFVRVPTYSRSSKPRKSTLRDRVPSFLVWNLQNSYFPCFRTKLLANLSLIIFQIYYAMESSRMLEVHKIERRWLSSAPRKIFPTLNHPQFWCAAFCAWLWSEQDNSVLD